MRKYLIIVACLLLVMPAVVSIAASERPADGPIDVVAMVKEIKAYTQTADRPHPWVTDIVAQYIPIGSDQAEVIDILQKNKFIVTDQTNRPYNKNKLDQYDTMLMFRKKIRIQRGFMWGHIIGVYLDFKDGKLAGIRGRVFYRHPLF